MEESSIGYTHVQLTSENHYDAQLWQDLRQIQSLIENKITWFDHIPSGGSRDKLAPADWSFPAGSWTIRIRYYRRDNIMDKDQGLAESLKLLKSTILK